jgi:hypothetical protein
MRIAGSLVVAKDAVGLIFGCTSNSNECYMGASVLQKTLSSQLCRWDDCWKQCQCRLKGWTNSIGVKFSECTASFLSSLYVMALLFSMTIKAYHIIYNRSLLRLSISSAYHPSILQWTECLCLAHGQDILFQMAAYINQVLHSCLTQATPTKIVLSIKFHHVLKRAKHLRRRLCPAAVWI